MFSRPASSFEPFDFGASGGGTAVLDPPDQDRRRKRGRRLDDIGLPPFDGGGGDGGGGGGGDWGNGDGAEGDLPDPRREDSAAFGLGLILTGVTTLFLIFLAALVLMRTHAREWPPAGTPALPAGMWGSTLVLLASSVTAARAVAAARAADANAAVRFLSMTLALGLLFVAVQATLWGDLAASGLFPSSSGYGTLFYALTGLHAAHVVCGLIYLGVVLARQRHARGAASVKLCAVYWHFMGGIWIVLALVLWL